ncbi:hypothetical protein ACIPPS_17925 [Streptomyces sp. NPDC090127]|uniref:hypothetical protein n=1 Tax=Streptomyces sp. NPDC090127 TaxID=3365953 RepID=UPI00381A3EBF
MGGTPLVRLSRRARPMALASAVATLLAALFVCLGATGDPTSAAAHDGSPRAHHRTAAVAVDEYVCPYDRGGCSLFPSLSPAVLTAPPPAPPPHAEGRLAGPVPAYATGRVSRSGAQPRAPDLHVLQVLRT